MIPIPAGRVSRSRNALLAAAALTLPLLVVGSAHAQTPEQFYKGKTVNVIIGSAVGAGYDAYGRLVARHLGKHIPGNPSVVPQNLDGAGGYRAAARVAIGAPLDGTYIAAVYPSTLLDPILGDPRRKVERLNLAYIGSASKNLAACFVRTDAPVKTFAEMLEKEVIVGAGNQGSTTRQGAAILKNVLGAKLKVSAGYTGNAQIYLAMDRGEVQGMCGTGYVGLASLRANWLKENFVNIVVQESLHGIPELNARKIPRALEYAKSDEQRRMLEVYYGLQEYGRPFVVAAGIPADRLAALQQAFMSTLKDPELLADSAKSKLEVEPLTGAELEKLVQVAYSTPPEVMAKLRQALEYEE